MTLSEIFADFICEGRPLPPGAEALCKCSILDTCLLYTSDAADE